MAINLGPGITLGPGVRIDPVGSPYVTANLILNMDAGNPASYPGTGNVWTNTVDSTTFTLYNSPPYNPANGGSLTFNPSDSQYAEGPSLGSPLTTWTVEAWHYYTGVNIGSLPCIVTEVFEGAHVIPILGSANAGFPNLETGFYYGGWQVTPGGITLTPGNWYQLAGTWDGTTVRLYINGAEVTSSVPGIASPNSSAGIRFMRRWDNPDYWGGGLSIVRIYDADIGSVGVTRNFNADKSRFGL